MRHSKVSSNYQRAGVHQVDLGGRTLACEIAGTGSPPVVFDTGLATPRTTWDRVWPAITAMTTALRYDRAGLGESDPGPYPRTTPAIVHDLRTLLLQLQLMPPYVLVGHSYGGLNMQYFAQTFPQEVAGLVLIDSAWVGQFPAIAASLPLATSDEPEPLRSYRQAILHDPAITNPEGVDWPTSDWYVRQGWLPEDLPVIVLTRAHVYAEYPPGFPPAVAAAADAVCVDLATMVVRQHPRAQHRIADHSGHFIHWDQPEVVITAIRDMLTIVRGTANMSMQPTSLCGPNAGPILQA